MSVTTHHKSVKWLNISLFFSSHKTLIWTSSSFFLWYIKRKASERTHDGKVAMFLVIVIDVEQHSHKQMAGASVHFTITWPWLNLSWRQASILYGNEKQWSHGLLYRCCESATFSDKKVLANIKDSTETAEMKVSSVSQYKRQGQKNNFKYKKIELKTQVCHRMKMLSLNKTWWLDILHTKRRYWFIKKRYLHFTKYWNDVRL